MARILIADDEPAILQSTAALLEVFGYEVHTVADAHCILEEMRSVRPDVLLQDVRMPNFDVREHIKALKADPTLRDTPFIIFSAYVNAQAIADEVGANGALEKPFDPEDLHRLVQSILGEGTVPPTS